MADLCNQVNSMDDTSFDGEYVLSFEQYLEIFPPLEDEESFASPSQVMQDGDGTETRGDQPRTFTLS